LLPGSPIAAAAREPPTRIRSEPSSTGSSRRAAPELLGVRRDSSGTVVMTRPVCLYGENAVYKGHGNTNDENNFICKPYAAGFNPSGP
jgi:hypothetical protein